MEKNCDLRTKIELLQAAFPIAAIRAVHHHRALEKTWREILDHPTKQVEFAIVHTTDPRSLLDLAMRTSDSEFSSFRNGVEYQIEKGDYPEARKVSELLKSIQKTLPSFQAKLIIKSVAKPKPSTEPIEQTKALAEVTPKQYELTANDRRFLRSLRIGC